MFDDDPILEHLLDERDGAEQILELRTRPGPLTVEDHRRRLRDSWLAMSRRADQILGIACARGDDLGEVRARLVSPFG